MNEIIDNFFSDSKRGRKYKLMFEKFSNGHRTSLNIFAGIFSIPWLFLRGLLLPGVMLWLVLSIVNRILYNYVGIDDMAVRGVCLIAIQFFLLFFYGEYLFYKNFQKLVEKYKKQGLGSDDIVEKLKTIYPFKLHRF